MFLLILYPWFGLTGEMPCYLCGGVGSLGRVEGLGFHIDLQLSVDS